MSERIVENFILAVGMALMVSACQAPAPRELSGGHVAEQTPAEASRIPAPVRRIPFVPPPPASRAAQGDIYRGGA